MIIPLAFLALIAWPLFHWLLPWLLDLKVRMLNGGASSRLWLCELLFSASTCRVWLNGTYLVLAVAMGSLFPIVILAAAWQEAKSATEAAEKAALQSLARFSYVQPVERFRSVPILVLWSVVDEALQLLNFSWCLHRAALWAMRLLVILAMVAGIAAIYGGLLWVHGEYNAEMAKPSPSSQDILWRSLEATLGAAWTGARNMASSSRPFAISATARKLRSMARSSYRTRRAGPTFMRCEPP